MSTDLPDWIAEGAPVAEQKRGYTYTTVARITPTLVVLANGSRYRRADIGKVGEKGPWVGANSPTRLVSAAGARRAEGRRAVSRAGETIRRACDDIRYRDDADPASVLDA